MIVPDELLRCVYPSIPRNPRPVDSDGGGYDDNEADEGEGDVFFSAEISFCENVLVFAAAAR